MANSLTYFERFNVTKEIYDSYGKLIELYGAQCPKLKAQWEARRRMYEVQEALR